MNSEQHRIQKAFKRVLDVLIAGTALLVLFPLILLLCLLIRLTMGSPVLFRQPRPGYQEKIFTFYKFRTMTQERDAQGNFLPDADRLTRFGQFLRSWSLDELPQIFNVLKGDLSIVGPRPLLVEYLGLYDEDQHRRHQVTPGLFSLATTYGRNLSSWEEKFGYDLWYVDHWSLWLDLKIMVRTAGIVLSRTGVSEAGQATASKFTGQPARKREGEA